VLAAAWFSSMRAWASSIQAWSGPSSEQRIPSRSFQLHLHTARTETVGGGGVIIACKWKPPPAS
jgi:hypothetical protein